MVRNGFGALLKGLLRCTACDAAMCHSHTGRGSKRWRYYICTAAQRKGDKTCPARSLPAGPIEEVVVGQVRRIGTDPALQEAVFAQARQQDETRLAELEAERRTVEKDLARWAAQQRAAAREARADDAEAAAVGRLADLEERIADAERQLVAVKEQAHELRRRC